MRNVIFFIAWLISAAPAQSQSVPVTPDNFARAESDMYLARAANRGGFGQFVHLRDFPLENTGVRPNRDTLYSQAVFDLDAGSVTITMPDTGGRFLSLQVINQDHYALGVYYGAGAHTFARDKVGTRYLFVFVRMLVDPNRSEDLAEMHKAQDAVKVSQSGGPGKLELPNWDTASQDKVRKALLQLNETLPDLRKAGGRRDEVDPVRHLIGSASAWGLNPDKDAIYLTVTPARNDGKVVYGLNVPSSVPVDAFWSITVYDSTGHFRKNDLNAYSLNNVTATKNADGSVPVQFGGCNEKIPNCLPVLDGWNYMVRLYRPRAEILDGTWKFPEAQPVN
jgi:hypothetical protein